MSETEVVPCSAVRDFSVNVTAKSSAPAKLVTNFNGIGCTALPFCAVVT